MNWQRLRDESIAGVLDWAEAEPWAKRMAACAQDAEWHAEGDVWTHTKLVCAQLPLLEQWPELSDQDRTVLVFTALFHDSAKPLTTQVDPESGRVTTPKHAIKGEMLARQVLRELGCDLASREEISRMVRYHGRPVFLLERPEPVSVLALLPDRPPRRLDWRRERLEVARAEGPERLEPAWWDPAEAGTPARDYYRLEARDGRRLWVFRAGRDWFLQGLFA